MQAGARVAGYVLTRPLGAGGFGSVWEAQHPETGHRLAIKTLLPYGAATRDVVRRFRREAALLRRVRSESVARIVDFVVDEAAGLVLLMELVEGESLKAVLSRASLSIEESIDLGISILSGVVDVHRAGVVHRDIKPSNIILRPRPDGTLQAVLLDFGLARARRSPKGEPSLSRITDSQATLGTVHYMAPEQLLNAHSATERSDVYAVGAILYFALTGHHPFGDEEGVAARRKLAEDPEPLGLPQSDRLARGVEAIVLRAMRRRPLDRFASAPEMMAALEALRPANLPSGAAGAAPVTSEASTRMSERRRNDALRFWLEVAGFVLLCVVVLGLFASVLPDACR